MGVVLVWEPVLVSKKATLSADISVEIHYGRMGSPGMSGCRR
jgi:hypothetical protein